MLVSCSVTHLSLFMDAIEAQHKAIFWSKKDVVYDAISLGICVRPLPHFFKKESGSLLWFC